MAANIFVDIASTSQMTEGDCTSLCEFFRQYINKKTDADIHTKPAVILVEDDLLKIFSSEANFDFDAASGNINYKYLKTARSETDIFERCFGGDFRYVTQNYRSNASRIVLALTAMFISFFGDGKDGLSEMVQTLSNGRFDYDKNKAGDWRFWYRHSSGEWRRSSLCMFTNYLFDVSRDNLKHMETDKYFIDWFTNGNKSHIGYMFVGYLYYLDEMQNR